MSADDHTTATRVGLEATTLEICTDCEMMLANGEGTPEHAAAMRAVWGVVDITLGRLTDDDDDDDNNDGFFSWQQCDGCHSPLGGNRGYATAWTPIQPMPAGWFQPDGSPWPTLREQTFALWNAGHFHRSR